jgi:hypothetical protein
MRLALAAVVLLGLAIGLVVLTRPHPTSPVVVARADAAAANPIAPPPPALPSTDAGAPPSTARAERELLLSKIIDHLGGHEGWNEQGTDLLRAFGRGAVATSDLNCYMAGCIATFTFASEDAFHATYDEVTTSPRYAAWTGGKRVTAPELLPDGRVIVAVALERPD